MEDLTQEFVAESREGLERMELCLTELEQRHGDADLVGEIFRVVHTIKGTTGFLGYKRLEKLAHSGENLLGLLREGKLAATAAVITVLLELLDGLRFILRAIEANETEGGFTDCAEAALANTISKLTSLGLWACNIAFLLHPIVDRVARRFYCHF